MSNTEQRSEEWHEERLGRFTASEIYKLMGIKGIGQTGKSYAIEKAIETLFGRDDDNFVSYDMMRGIELEPLAFEKFKELMKLKFIEVENCGFFSLLSHAGASPDGLVGNDAILEIKCPKKETFFKLVATNEIDNKYFLQMQMQMICTGRKKAYFFNYLIINGIEYHHIIEVNRDEDVCEKIIERISKAIQIKEEYITKINNNKQF
jgi:exodeoxyribonuclease (lambda-induced)